MAISWALKRQLTYLGGLLGVIAVIAFIYFLPTITKKPTCFDGAQNGAEAGVDCGGDCLKYCPFQVNGLTAVWRRSYMVAPNIYNAVAYVENQNISAGIPKISYEFSLYDENNVFIAKREGETYVGPNARTAVFEPGINVGNRIPKYTTFKFVGEPDWYKVSAQAGGIKLLFREQELVQDRDDPRLTVVIQNDSSYDLDNVEVVAILYNKDDNAIAASKTLIEKLDKGSDRQLFFSWPTRFAETVSRIELIPRYDVFSIRS